MRLAVAVLLLLSAVPLLAAEAEEPSPLKPFADLLWTYTHVEEQSKSVVAEFGSFLAVIESPGDEAAARAMLADLAEAFPDDARAAYYLGMVRLELGEDAAAEAAWTRCLELSEDAEERADWEESMAKTRERVAKMREEGDGEG